LTFNKSTISPPPPLFPSFTLTPPPKEFNEIDRQLILLERQLIDSQRFSSGYYVVETSKSKWCDDFHSIERYTDLYRKIIGRMTFNDSIAEPNPEIFPIELLSDSKSEKAHNKSIPILSAEIQQRIDSIVKNSQLFSLNQQNDPFRLENIKRLQQQKQIEDDGTAELVNEDMTEDENMSEEYDEDFGQVVRKRLIH